MGEEIDRSLRSGDCPHDSEWLPSLRRSQYGAGRSLWGLAGHHMKGVRRICAPHLGRRRE